MFKATELITRLVLSIGEQQHQKLRAPIKLHFVMAMQRLLTRQLVSLVSHPSYKLGKELEASKPEVDATRLNTVS